MLTGLRLRNIALIDSLDLSFDEGFIVLTGETGAGKSILLDALDAVLGGFQGMSGFRLLRDGEEIGSIEASFSCGSLVDNWLTKQKLEIDDSELVISREFRKKRNRVTSRSRLNGVLVNRDQLLALRPFLLDLTLQDQSHHIFKAGQQRNYLDHFGGNEIDKHIQKVRKSWLNWHESHLNLLQIQDNHQNSQLQKQEKEQIYQELKNALLEDPDEDRKLEIEQDRLINAVRLQEGLSLLMNLLQENNGEFPTASDLFAQSMQELKTIVQLDNSLDRQKDQLCDLQISLQSMIDDLQKYYTYLESDSSRLSQVQERLYLLKKLQNRYGFNLSQLIHHRDRLHEEIFEFSHNNDLEELRSQEEKKRIIRDEFNDNLTKIRKQIALSMQLKLMNNLIPMGLENVQFEIRIIQSEPSQNGSDDVQFWFSANPGQPLSPLEDVVSGGELSRFFLALKTTVSQIEPSRTMFFDEIDSGVSGRVSSAIGKLLKELSSSSQVFCITHQPLVAALADHHLKVSKHVENGCTRSEVISLQNIQLRQTELAELAGGNFKEAAVYAARLLEQQVA